MFNFLSNNLIWTQGFSILVVLLLLFFLGIVRWRILILLSIFAFLFTLYFFRNPDRSCPEFKQNSSVIISPADGEIVEIQHSDENGLDGYANKISIFLSVFDVHVNRFPVSGVIKHTKYSAGEFRLAFLPKSSEVNERNEICIEDSHGRTILVRQIAGTIARKICCWTKQGDHVTAGNRFGMIKFGSRVDIFLPKGISVDVEKGQKVYGGQTVLGMFKDSEDNEDGKEKSK